MLKHQIDATTFEGPLSDVPFGLLLVDFLRVELPGYTHVNDPEVGQTRKSDAISISLSRDYL